MISFINNINMNGPRTVLCGTPDNIGRVSEDIPPTTTDKFEEQV